MSTTYTWEGIDKHGMRVKGVSEKSSDLAVAQSEIVAELQHQEITPLKIIRQYGVFHRLKELQNLWSRKKIKRKELVDFSKQLSKLINANIPIITALDILSHDVSNLELRQLIVQLKKKIEAGSTLYAAFKNYSQYFSELQCNLIGIGERSGTLDVILKQIAAHDEQVEDQRRKVIKALFYPGIVLLVAFVITGILLIFVVPQFKSMFASFGAPLPAYTRFIITVSELISHNCLLILAGIAGIAIFCAVSIKHNARLSYAYDVCKLRIPFLGMMLQKVLLARCMRIWAITFKAGISLPEVLLMTSNVIGNKIYKNGIVKMQHQLSNGMSLHAAMQMQNLFPTRVLQLVSLGEESGTLDDVLLEMAIYYEEELAHIIAYLNDLLEPLIMIVLGILVGGLIIGMYLPVFRLGKII